MSIEWKTLRAELPDDVQARLNGKRDMRRLGKVLGEIRKGMALTQQELADRASMTQNTVSKIENPDDLLVSSLVRYMHAMGGSVELILNTPDGHSRRVDFNGEISVESSA